MNTTELVDAVASATGTAKTNAKAAVDAVFAAISSQLAAGNEVSINGFGKFNVKASPEREGRNPATGEAMTIAASKTAKFKPSKTLKDQL